MRWILLFTIYILWFPSMGQNYSWNEEFEVGLKEWNHRSFTWNKNKIDQVSNDGMSHLRIRSENSAGGIWKEQDLAVDQNSVLKWKWKVDALTPELDETQKSGDDYAIRIFVIFEEPRFFGLDYGKQLCYVWSRSKPTREVFSSPFSESVGMVVVQSGEMDLRQWIEQERNIAEDYKSYFGSYPEKIVGFAIMSDTDNSNSKTLAYLDYLKVEHVQ